MRPEAAFVLALARGEIGRATDSAAGSLDGDLVVRLTTHHQVDALCSWMWRKYMDSATEVHRAALSEPVVQRLRHAYLHHLLRNESLVRDLTDLQGALAARAIEALFLKGPWLAFHAYPDPGTRPIGDIDLAIQENDYPEAVVCLREVGYVPVAPLPQSPKEALRRSHYAEQLRFLGRGRRPVELHFRLVNVGPPSINEDWVWEGARSLKIGECTVRVPGPEAMVLHLLLHANQHSFAVLRLLQDIRWALEKESTVDWEMLRGRIRHLRCRASAYHALLLARDLAGADVPQQVLDGWRPGLLRRSLFSFLWRVSAARRLEVSRRRMETESPFLFLLEMGRTKDKARYLAALFKEAGGLGPFLKKTRRIFSRRVPGSGEGRS